MKKVAKALVFLLVFNLIPILTSNAALAQTDSARESLLITYSPAVLTAGVVSELVDPSNPFTITITDGNSNPVDLTNGGAIEDEDVWNLLFKDVHPEELPQYYWTRFDLHNDDGTDICNKTLFPDVKYPINIDFSMAEEGIYIFNGFCANDEGEFDIAVYTPDRKRYGKVTVNVESPQIDYEIWNIEAPDKIFHTPGDPDFVMTAADNRVYGIIPTVSTADGRLIRGVASTVRTCGSYTDARLTVTSTALANFYFNEATEVLARDPITNKYIKYISDMGNRYWINLGIDWDNDNILEQLNNEIYDIAYFNVRDGQSNTSYKTFYNTTCTRWDDGSFTTGYLFEYENTEAGWGMGCIYNSPYLGCYLMPDFNDDGMLNYRDSLSLDENGQTKFYIFANDVCGITCLIGVNDYGNSDLAGGGPATEDDPREIKTRYNPDGTFKLDMDAFVKHSLSSGSTTVSNISARVSIDPEKPEVGIETNCRVIVTTKDDKKPVVDAKVTLSGAGVLMTKKSDDNGIANFTFTPTSSDWINVTVEGGSKNGSTMTNFKIGKDKTPPELEIDDDIPTLTNENFVDITGVTEPGTSIFVDEVEAEVDGSGKFKLNFELGEGENIIKIKAVDSAGNTTRKSLSITLDTAEPYLDVDAVDERYIEATSIVIKGRVDEESEVSIGLIDGVRPVKTSSQFEFIVPVEFGENKLEIIATDLAGNITKREFSLTNFRRTTIIMQIDSTEFVVNGETKELRFAPFIENGSTMVPVRAISEAFGAKVEYDGNTRSIDIILDDIQILLQIGVPHMIVRGEKVKLAVAPMIKNSSTFVPLRAISEAFNGDVDWAPETKEITIERLFIPQ